MLLKPKSPHLLLKIPTNTSTLVWGMKARLKLEVAGAGSMIERASSSWRYIQVPILRLANERGDAAGLRRR